MGKIWQRSSCDSGFRVHSATVWIIKEKKYVTKMECDNGMRHFVFDKTNQNDEIFRFLCVEQLQKGIILVCFRANAQFISNIHILISKNRIEYDSGRLYGLLTILPYSCNIHINTPNTNTISSKQSLNLIDTWGIYSRSFNYNFDRWFCFYFYSLIQNLPFTIHFTPLHFIPEPVNAFRFPFDDGNEYTRFTIWCYQLPLHNNREWALWWLYIVHCTVHCLLFYRSSERSQNTHGSDTFFSFFLSSFIFQITHCLWLWTCIWIAAAAAHSS